jgi:V8-like Glu-specific endopeptidase
MSLRSTIIILALVGCTSPEESTDCPEGFLRDNNDNCIEVDDSDADTDTDSDTDADSNSDTDADGDTGVEVGDYGESVIGENDWTDVKDLSSTSQRRFLATYVGYYSLDGYGSRCTATLVAPTLIITNYHCASSSAQYQNVRVNFGYLEEENYNAVADLRDEGYSCTEYVLGNQEEDVALLKCPEEDNDEHVVSDDIAGFLELPLSNNESIELGNSLYVLHQNCYYEGEKSVDGLKMTPLVKQSRRCPLEKSGRFLWTTILSPVVRVLRERVHFCTTRILLVGLLVLLYFLSPRILSLGSIMVAHRSVIKRGSSPRL